MSLFSTYALLYEYNITTYIFHKIELEDNTDDNEYATREFLGL